MISVYMCDAGPQKDGLMNFLIGCVLQSVCCIKYYPKSGEESSSE